MAFTRKIIEEENSDQALKLLKEYLTNKWYPGQRILDGMTCISTTLIIIMATGLLSRVLFASSRDWIINS